MSRKRDYEPLDSTRYPSRTKKCKYGHEGRISKMFRTCSGCLEDHLKQGGWVWQGLPAAKDIHRKPQERRRREDSDYPMSGVGVDDEGRENGSCEFVVLVCGSREWTDKLAIWDALFPLMGKATLLIHGGARGADTIAGEVAQELGIPIRVFPADWDRYGKGAGFIRNSQMMKEEPDLVLAFGEGKGTEHTVGLARKAGIKVSEWHPGDSNVAMGEFTH